MTPGRTTRSLVALCAAVGLAATGCGRNGDDGGSTAALKGTVTVSAAASLTAAFDDAVEQFEDDNPDIDVKVTYDSSSTLAGQIVEDGAPVDVFASADEANMAKLADADLLDTTPTVFARNQLVIITKPGNPESITSVEDLAGVGTISLCGAEVPCGKFAAEVFDAAGVTIDEDQVTRGQNATATLTAVTEGDAVAGIVYVTDELGAGDEADTVPIPDENNVVATYPIAVLKAAPKPDAAQAFVDFVVGDEGQAILEERGFLAPR